MKFQNVTDIRYNDPSTVPLSHSSDDDKSLNKDSRAPLVDDNMYSVISEHCLPKLVCELHRKSMEEFESFSESEKNLVRLIG